MAGLSASSRSHYFFEYRKRLSERISENLTFSVSTNAQQTFLTEPALNLIRILDQYLFIFLLLSSPSMKNKSQKATFAAGCFWSVEEVFRELKGVLKTTVGYTGGKTKNPTYEQVCSDKTGHAEAVEIEFDPTIISYEKLLDIFWECHDPTQMNRQGPDEGTQYRSAIFYHSEEQKKLALASKQKLEKSKKYNTPIVTEIVSASDFYRAEDYHQQYLAKRGMKTCRV